MSKTINPSFDDAALQKAETFINHIDSLTKPKSAIPHREVFDKLLEQIQPISFRDKTGIEAEDKLKNNHFYIITVEQVLSIAHKNQWGICQRHDFTYLYNGAYWSLIENENGRVNKVTNDPNKEPIKGLYIYKM